MKGIEPSYAFTLENRTHLLWTQTTSNFLGRAWMFELLFEPMASVFKKPTKDHSGYTPYWFAAFRDARGQRRQRSTKLTDKKSALRLADQWEQLASAGRSGLLVEAACRQVVSDLHKQVTGRPVAFYTTETWLAEWLADCEGTAKPRTLERYKATCASFLSALGEERAKQPLAMLSAEDVRRYRDELRAGGRSPSTCNQEVKILRSPLERAQRLGHIAVNPAADVKRLTDEESAPRAAFTTDQIESLLTTAADTDWQGAIMLGALCGLRLKDAANLVWSAVDFSTGLLTVTTGKRGVKVQVPMHPALIEWLKGRPRGIGKAPVLPALHGKPGSGKSGLSMAFKRIMAKAGVVGETAREGHGKGRTTSTLTFHSTRHYFVSALSAGGVASDTRQRLAGHTDAKSHAVYSKHELESLRAAIATLPAVGGAK